MPAGAIDIAPGQSIQHAVNAASAGAVFRLRTGVHQISAPIMPKSGQIFVGEYGAILDGTGWTTSDLDAAAFKALNVDVDNVVIRNLEIRNMPQKAVMAWRDYSSGWVVDQCDIHHCKNGVEVPGNSSVSNCTIHHCVGTPGHANPAERGGGYSFNAINGLRFTGNEVSYNGTEQKWILCTNVVCSGNVFHHNAYAGPWIDGGGAGSVIEDNISDDNGGPGICVEIADHVIVRRNSCNRNKEGGILVSASQANDVSENTVGNNAFGIDLFVDCIRLTENYPPHPQPDLMNNTFHHNTVTAGAGQFAVAMTHQGDCGAPYVSNSKNNQFYDNTYHVGSGSVWIWGNGQNKTFEQWQALGFDTGVPAPSDPTPPPPPPPEPADPLPPSEPGAICTLDGTTYPAGAQVSVQVRTGQVSKWEAEHPDWRVVSKKAKNRTQTVVTAQCEPH